MRKMTRAGLAAALVISIGLAAGAPAHADDIDNRLAAAQKAAADHAAKRDELKASLDETTALYQQAVLALSDAQAKLPVAQAELDRATADLEAAQREAEVLAQRLKDAQDEQATVSAEVAAGASAVEAARLQIAALARQEMRSQGGLSALGLVTGAQSTADFLQQYSVSNSAARAQSRTVAQIQDTQATAVNQQARLGAIQDVITQLKQAADENIVVQQQAQQAATDRKAEVESLIAQQQSATDTIKAEKDAVKAAYDQNEADYKQTQADIANLKNQQKERDEAIAKAKAEAEAKKKAEEEARQKAAADAAAAAAAGGAPAPPPPNGAAPTSFLQFPLHTMVLTSGYGMRLDPYYHLWQLHAGIDLGINCGTPVYASQTGYVVQTAYAGGRGNYVLIDHGTDGGAHADIMTLYQHLSRWVVSVNQTVTVGQLIAYSGTTGASTGCHLHEEVWVNGATVNPLTMLPPF
jgi:murein DD-endopeptidase MepM/ murein hydrolase activator NlpD